MNNTPKLVVIGYTNIDVNRYPDKTVTLPGGAAYFTSIAASKILQPIGLITRIGPDFDTSFLFSRVLKKGIRIIPDKSTARSTQIYSSLKDLSKRDIKLDWGVAPDLCPNDIPLSWIKSSRIIHIATMPPRQQLVFLKYIRKTKHQAQISIDTDIFLLNNRTNLKIIKDLFAQVNLIFVNKREFAKLKKLLRKLKNVILKKDKGGCEYLRNGKSVLKVPAKQVHPIDPTGAGDIFAGIFLASRLKGLSLKESLSEATNLATQSVTQNGIMHLFT